MPLFVSRDCGPGAAQQTLLVNLDDARANLAVWIVDYNPQRPYSSLTYAALTATDHRLGNRCELRPCPLLHPRHLAYYKTLAQDGKLRGD
ncbi:hypothetical protein IVB27_04640 [Bradyrhizobium sp. 197]|uniref:transposase n=1 Tax=unclassified Bradyrhizobium TaxID=2631580 RepID=UPI001FF7B272|nr:MULTISPECIES: transposase [unclassified Bradyrhizobium]MCK1474119.1 hypothetical protein [Bradyrhizobium sp. 197]MCK1518808.1 hypothetical protein [Bradyrhizobium sp. 17]